MTHIGQPRSRSPSRSKASDGSASRPPREPRTPTKTYTEEQRKFIAEESQRTPNSETIRDTYNKTFPEDYRELHEIKRMRKMMARKPADGLVGVEGRWAERLKKQNAARLRNKYACPPPLVHPSKCINCRAKKKEFEDHLRTGIPFDEPRQFPGVMGYGREPISQLINSETCIDQMEGLMRELQADSDDDSGRVQIDLTADSDDENRKVLIDLTADDTAEE
ncbi:hypothetical protein MMC13_006520 [Lambiella insularis]|nr:hypothetical protein [Lambiella insularis]